MRREPMAIATILAGLAAATAGCGNSDNSPNGSAGTAGTAGSAGTSGSGGTGGVGGAAGQGGASTVTFEFKYQLLAGDPIEGGMVALDHRDGTRQEAVTDAAGVAAFEVVPSEILSVIAYKPDHHLAAMSGDRIVELGETTVPLVDFSREPSDAVFATLSGTASDTVGLTLLVKPSGSGDHYQDSGPDFSVEVIDSEAFALVAIDFSVQFATTPRTQQQTLHAWYAAEVDGFSGDSTHDIGFSMSPMVALVSGTAPMPSDPALSSSGYFYFRTQANQLSLGFPTLTAPSEQGDTFEFDAEYVDMPSLSAGHPIVTQYETFLRNGRRSWAELEGHPIAGSNPVPFASPAALAGQGGNHDAITLSWQADSHTEGIYAVYLSADGVVYGSMNLAAGASESVLPLLPSNVDEASLFVGATQFMVQTCPEVREALCVHGTATEQVTLD